MPKVICSTVVDGPLFDASYKAPSGKVYEFRRSAPTEVDASDVDFFTRSNGGNIFKVVSLADKVKEVVSDVVDKVKVVVEGESHVQTAVELKKLNKGEQTDLLRKLDFKGAIPSKEEDRVSLILQLQGGK